MLSKDFYCRDPAEVSRRILGNELVKDGLRGRIVEAEAYYGPNDPASHAYNGKTKRNKLMFGGPGKTYVYLCYGMYHLLNFTTREKGKPGAVLIRALEPLEGVEKMKRNRGTQDGKELTNGPGKLTEALGITKEHNGLDVTNNESLITVEEGKQCNEVGKSKRIGVSENHEEDLRFFLKNSKYVSDK